MSLEPDKVKPKERIFFRGFDEIRGIAALAVVFHHVELYKHRLGLDSLFKNKFIKPCITFLGANGVNLFFALSGFLITYLLLHEHKISGRIDVKKFYIRRILRIWPLYYLVLAIALFIFPTLAKVDFFSFETFYNERIFLYQARGWSSCLFFVFFLPNIALSLKIILVGASHFWSVGVEEQFYLFWPVLIKKCIKHLELTLWLFLIIKLGLTYSLYFFISPRFELFGIPIYLVKALLMTLKFEIMAVGGLFALYYFKQNRILKKIFSIRALFVVLCALAISLSFLPKLTFALAVIFAAIICYVAINQNLNIPWLAKMGKISYGIYMYHPFMMYLSFAVANNYFREFGLFYHPLSHLMVFGSTIILSHFSYQYFEKLFLKKKTQFAVIESGARV